MLMLVGAANIDGVAAVRSGIMQPHTAAATAADGNALQQGAAPPRHPMAVYVVPIEVVREPPLVRHELLPIDISRKGILQANRPILDRHRLGRASWRTGTPADRRAPAPAVNIRPCISRVLQNLKDAGAARRPPNDIVRCRSVERPHRQQQIGFQKVAHDRLGAAKLSKLRKQVMQPRLHLFVGIEADPAVPAVRQTRRQGHSQLASRRLLSLALVQPQLDLMQFGLAHDPGQAKQQPVMIGARVVEALAVGNQHPEQRAQFQELMPIAVVACQP